MATVRASARAMVRDAATVMLVRDRPDLEVLLLRRTPDAVFGPGASVFPGGAVEASDRSVYPRVVGLDDAAASAEHGLERDGLAFRVAAVRECFEEAGLLVARDRTGAFASVGPEWRDALNAGHATLAHVLDAEDLVVDARDLRLFSHWLTPVGAPRRYDTWFFVAAAPDAHEAEHDDRELVASGWMRPIDALDADARGDVDLIFPTLCSLRTLARFGKVAELLDALDAVPRRLDGRPCVLADHSGERVVLPFDEPEGRPRGAAVRSWTIPLPDIEREAEARAVGGHVLGGRER